MSFLNPLVLFGLAAASIPIILHLLHLRRMKKVEFSTLKFLKELKKNAMRSLKIRHWILLALRTLAIIFLVLAFARPTIDSALPGLSTAFANRSVVIVLDNSISMDVSDIEGNRLRRARDIAQHIIDNAQDGDEIAVLFPADLEDKRAAELSPNRQYLTELVGQTMPIYSRANLANAMRYGETLLQSAKHIEREVIVISDMQPNILHSAEGSSVILSDKGIRTTFVKIGGEEFISEMNISLDSIVPVTKLLAVNKPLEIRAHLTNHFEEAADEIIISMIFNGERVAQKSLSIPAKGTATIELAALPREAGVLQVDIETETDAFLADNKRSVGVVLKQSPRIALVGEGSLFSELALVAAEKDSALVKMSAAGMLQTDIGRFDALLIHQMPKLSPGDVNRLLDYVNKGGGLFIFSGGEFPLSEGAEMLLSALQIQKPQPLAFEESRLADITYIDKQHPLFEGVFSEQNTGTREIAQIKEGYAFSGGNAIVKTGDNALLVEQKHGSGRVIICGLESTTGKSRFSVSGLFAPLVLRSVEYITAGETAVAQYTIGEAALLDIPGRYSGEAALTMAAPDNTETTKLLSPTAAGSKLLFDDSREPGVYVVKTAAGEIISTLSFGIDPTESDMSVLAEEKLKEQIASWGGNDAKVLVVSKSDDIAQIAAVGSAGGSELWKLFVILALIAVLAEMGVAWTLSRNSAAGQPA